ncbi:MAG: hypothetical protein U0Q16_36675 [Bryobacteraceae bacterium]
MKARLLIAVALAPVLYAESKRVTVRETAGLARAMEPVSVTVDGKERTLYVTIGARQTKTFRIEKLRAKEPLDLRPTDRVGFTVENGIFLADLSKRIVNGQEEDSGTLRALTFKPLNVTLRRTQNRMHWAPSFQRIGARGYTSIAMWHPVQQHARREVDGAIIATREGYHALYPEIRLSAEYKFFPHVPYFLFQASMTVEKPIQMFWLRGQEMTMDEFFTHVAWPGRDGKPRIATFDERKAILEREPIPVDAPWVAFLNEPMGYGFGAVSLAFRGSTLANAGVHINDGANNGKYWDRYLIGQKETALTPGDRYEEKTAYVLFRRLEEFLDQEKKLRNPLEVKVEVKVQ